MHNLCNKKMKMDLKLTLLLITLHCICNTTASNGDRSPFYQNCVKNCLKVNCTKDEITFTKEAQQMLDGWSRLLFWNCRDECRYNCMWRTVQGFKESNFDIPKFHGKWPFKRILGIQEPASMFASLLNLIVTVYMHLEIKQQFPVQRTPLLLFWHCFAYVCMNGWIWSIIFHTRDNPFTEFMDYASALSMVMALLVAAVVRVFHRRRKLTAVLLVIPILYYVEHVRYLYTGRIDYEFNIMANIVIGAIGSALWLYWSITNYLAGRRYTWRMIAAVIYSGAVLSLELFDFPPKYDTWDAHALWHLTTVGHTIMFYRCVIDDLHYLKSSPLPTGKKVALH